MDDDGLIYKLLDIKYPEAAPKGIHYNCLKPYCSETVLPAATHSVPQPPRDALPGFTALSGSLPLTLVNLLQTRYNGLLGCLYLCWGDQRDGSLVGLQRRPRAQLVRQCRSLLVPPLPGLGVLFGSPSAFCYEYILLFLFWNGDISFEEREICKRICFCFVRVIGLFCGVSVGLVLLAEGYGWGEVIYWIVGGRAMFLFLFLLLNKQSTVRSCPSSGDSDCTHDLQVTLHNDKTKASVTLLTIGPVTCRPPTLFLETVFHVYQGISCLI